MFAFLLTNDLFPRYISTSLSNLLHLLRLKIEMIVVAAPRIELCLACRTARVALHVIANGQHCSARAAEYRLLVPFILRPDRYRMIGECLVAILASVVLAATFHLDGDDVCWSV